jgi:DNA-directed RNA polymerase beta subunit
MSLDGQRIQARRGYTRFKLITNRNVRQILQARIVTDGMRRGMKGGGRSLVKQQMVSFTMYRGTLCTVVCPTCRVWQSYDGYRSKQTEPHHMHGTQWGVICPIESPDNKDIGLTKHFAVLARVTERGVVQDDVRKCLVDLGMVVSRWATGTPVWLNGTPQGVIS